MFTDMSGYYSFYASGAICCLSTFFFCLPLSWTSSAPSVVSLSRTFIKAELVMVETAWPCLQSLFCCSLVLIGLWWRHIRSFSQIAFVCHAFHATCVLKHNLKGVAFFSFPQITLESKTPEKNVFDFVFASLFRVSSLI